MNQVIVSVPDLNCNAKVEAFTTKIGAYTGAGITAILGGVAHGILGLGRGASMGFQVTQANVGSTPAVVETKTATTQVDENTKFVFHNGKLCTVDTRSGVVTPFTRGQVQQQPMVLQPTAA